MPPIGNEKDTDLEVMNEKLNSMIMGTRLGYQFNTRLPVLPS